VFISVNQLEQEMGVDKRIGRFFVDRRIPEQNSFWKGRLLYVSFGNGYLSIPVYYDLLHRIGIPLEKLLDEKHIEFMERLMHYAILQERNEISISEELKQIRQLLEGRIQDAEYYQLLNQYLDQENLKPLGPFGLRFSSLNRADVFLYVLCDLPLSKEQWEAAIRYWYSLHPTYLIMDDIRDYEKDRKNEEENVVIELGGGALGFEKTFDMFRENCSTMKEINPVLSEFLLNYEDELKENLPINVQDGTR
jgi:hypothetical protein